MKNLIPEYVAQDKDSRFAAAVPDDENSAHRYIYIYLSMKNISIKLNFVKSLYNRLAIVPVDGSVLD